MPEQCNTAVTLSGVTFSFRDRTVLEGIDLEVPCGTYCGIVGHNGAGKTTLAYLIAGILSPATGIVDTHGLRVGLVLANPQNQVVSLVVEEDVAFGPENLGLESGEILRRMDNALAQTHIEDLRQSLTSGLSGGQLAKVVFAGQLAMDVDIFVLDEGTAMLDPRNRAILLETVQELNRDLGKTVVHITHRMDDLRAADMVVGIDEGRIAHRSHGTLSLYEQCGVIGGVEPGGELVYRAFLDRQGLQTNDVAEATDCLARRLQERQG